LLRQYRRPRPASRHENREARQRKAKVRPRGFPQPYIREGKKGQASTGVEPFNLDSRKTIVREIAECSEALVVGQANADNPFFLHMALTQVHPPLGHNPDLDNITGIYGDIVTEVDYNVGRIVDALNEAGIADNTILILSGDNGAVKKASVAAPMGPGAQGSSAMKAGCGL